MKVLNLMWGFSLGGVRTCFLTYARLGEIEPELEMRSVCINLESADTDMSVLRTNKIEVVNIRHRLDFSWCQKCMQIINREDPDLIFTHGFNGPVVVEVLRRKYKLTVPMVCSYHSEYQAPTLSRRLLAPIFNGAMHWLYRNRAVCVLGVSSFTKKTLLGFGVREQKIEYVHNGIVDRPLAHRSLSRLLPLLKDERDRIIIGIASRLDAIKGLSFLLQALVIVREQYNVHLIILGDGPERNRLYDLAGKLRIADCVSFVGYQSNVPEWLEAFDIFCLPSLSEAMPLSLIEALRAGRAVVASDVGGIGEAVQHEKEALLVPHSDVQALAAAILRLSGNPKLRQQLGVNARKRFEADFKEERMKRQIADWLMSFDEISTGVEDDCVVDESIRKLLEKKKKRKATKDGKAKPLTILINLLHQSFFYLDRTERLMRILWEVIPCLIAFLFLNYFVVEKWNVFNVLSIVATVHLINWVLNNNFWNCINNALPWRENRGAELTLIYLERMKRRLSRKKSVTAIMLLGSICRKAWHSRSDIDLRILRAPGVKNGLVASLLVSRERLYAFINRQPLDIYLADTPNFLEQRRKDENPLFLYKNDDRLDNARYSMCEIDVVDLRLINVVEK